MFTEYTNYAALIKRASIVFCRSQFIETPGLASVALRLAKLPILNVDVERASSKIRFVNKERPESIQKVNYICVCCTQFEPKVAPQLK